jgi:hypothetical protein
LLACRHIAMPAILHPLPRIPMHVVETEGIRQKASDGCCVYVAVAAIDNKRILVPDRLAIVGGLIQAVAVAAHVIIVVTEEVLRIGAGLGPLAPRTPPPSIPDKTFRYSSRAKRRKPWHRPSSNISQGASRFAKNLDFERSDPRVLGFAAIRGPAF